jgi:PAS domain S-box-containing protein
MSSSPHEVAAPDLPTPPKRPGPVQQLDPATASLCLRGFLRGIPNIVSFKDTDSRFLAVSDSKAARHGTTAAELVGKSDDDLLSPDHAKWVRAEEESIIATGEPVISELQPIESLDGRAGWVESTKLPLRTADGTIIGTCALTYDVTDRQRLAADLEATRGKLISASRIAGMAEVATGVLHNVGNVLTSLNVSANVLSSGLRYSKSDSVGKLAQLLEEHRHDLGAFLTSDPKGRRVPEFIESLSQHLIEERDRMVNELTALQQNIDHIKEIVSMQQSYATMAGVVEPLEPALLVEDALRMNAAALMRHSVAVVREFHPVPRVRVERSKVLQILVNLIRNAKYAVDDAGGADKVVTIRICEATPGRVQIKVIDNGIGIPPENLERIFQHGFTTRSEGHGFGLHSARQAAAAMDASIEVESEGVGKGATFTLDLPVA